MDPNLTWLLLIAAAVLIVIGAVRFDLLTLPWRRPPFERRSEAPHNAPPAPRWRASSGFRPHDAPPHKPAFHRSGRRH